MKMEADFNHCILDVHHRGSGVCKNCITLRLTLYE